MPNIATVLKEEITRLVRKELRSETEALKKASGRYRSDIAALKRRIDTLEKQVSRLEKAAPKKAVVTGTTEAESKLRFRPDGFRALRKRLELSAEKMGALIGVSAQTIYNWEGGANPRREQLAAIATVRKMGKREVTARLEQIEAESA
ncbi:helix-turn-helix domain-containing protein [Thiobacillus denitrificans]|uniref:helix-turn-helix domain-containing protein n=1 Tax=Thiobacillus denitrificans TaxID=36861 RepID=UPI00036BEC8A|nr:helix-turn-helix transcriptional regulator [Thiobacillus denitrificans]